MMPMHGNRRMWPDAEVTGLPQNEFYGSPSYSIINTSNIRCVFSHAFSYSIAQLKYSSLKRNIVPYSGTSYLADHRHACCYILFIAMVGVSCSKSANEPEDFINVPDKILGTKANVNASSGKGNGFSVLTQCRSSNQLGVKGNGVKRVIDDGSVHAENDFVLEVFGTFRDTKIFPALRMLNSVHSIGLGVGCTEMGAIVYLSDWREADAAIKAMGNMLVREALGDEITITVTSPTVITPSTSYM